MAKPQESSTRHESSDPQHHERPDAERRPPQPKPARSKTLVTRRGYSIYL